MPILQPAIDTLGLAAPYLGPWFDDPAMTLAAPDTLPGSGDLSVTLQFGAAINPRWLPPATGVLSLHVATALRPAALAHLRKPDASAAFTDGALVALFSLLPEVAERLDTLTRCIPAADGSGTGAAPSRARVQCLALEFPDNAAARLADILPPLGLNLAAQDPTLNDPALTFGLQLSADGTTLDNDPRPMADLLQPGKLPLIGDFEGLVQLQQADSGQLRLHAFDQRGRPLDPGAVAAWWAALAAQYPELWAAGLTSPLPGSANDQRTVAVAPALTLQVVNAHEGPVGTTLQGRLDLAAAGMTPLALDNLWTQQPGAANTTVGFLPAPAGAGVRDDAPVPRAAALPSGRYAGQVVLWSGPASTPLARDFVRVAVVELEEHLVGQRRVRPANGTPEQNRRADAQQRFSTRVNIAQSLGPALLDSVDAATAAALAVISGNNAQIVAGALDADWGALPGLPAAVLPANFPATLPDMLAPCTLHGGDANANATPKLGQRVLLQISGLAAQAGYWLRAWPVGFDLATGERPALTGGAGRVQNSGNVALVVELPDGAGSGQLGVRFALTAPGGRTREYTEQRFSRPNASGQGSSGRPWGGNGATAWLLCEQGQKLGGLPGAGSIASGTTVVEVVAGGFALIDRSTIPPTAFDALTAASAVTAGDTLELTQPAFKAMPDGVVGANAAPTWKNAALHRAARGGTSPLTASSQPFASQERLDQAAASRAPAAACIWTAPSLARYHELGSHHSGHPGAPAAVEVHGTGVRLNGPAAWLVAEHTDDRIFSDAPALVTAATGLPDAPAVPPGANIWAAVLKTVAAAVEGDSGFGDKVVSNVDATQAYVFEPADGGLPARSYGDIKTWYDAHFVQTVAGIDVMGTRLPAAAGWSQPRIDAAKRAMDRRALEAGWGLREAMASISAALARAEDFVYIETPALDLAGIGPDAEVLLAQLMLRMVDRPLLCVLLCVPGRLMPGWPKSVELTRNQNLHDALGDLRAGTAAQGALGIFGGDRMAVFAPSAGQGRALRSSATTVIVDDAYAITGSTHLWRRGLSFDSSLAVAVFDEQLSAGRPADIVALRRSLVARQLSLPAGRVPDDPVALVAAIHRYNQLRSSRVSQAALVRPKLQAPGGPGWGPNDGWNPDGSYKPDANVLDLLYAFLQSNQDELA
jgi:hypothetical protein